MAEGSGDRAGNPQLEPPPPAGELDACVAAALAGDETAAANVFRAVQPALLSYLRSQLPSDAVEDAAAEVWLAVARGSAASVRSFDQLRALLFTIARRRVIDLRRGQRRRPVSLGEEAAEPVASDPTDGFVERLHADETVRRLMQLLTPDQAEIVLLRVVAGLSADAVAAVTGRTAGSVRVIQHRAMRRLAAEVQARVVTP
ncbi:sigma-70 family RNA polymerase sigma factor [Acidimicrobiaceae bacterium USS-CC1]|uniref:Sigma-70 family RNA polymerase sigma factor n=1 Tax=Acidiferrimicrobium australe TaxID=2664430 RepID=A0ABW9QX47_9ACTN|nr:sigma-70 family RNA polymerase sigma factor [Acidiferrimicrobium australe]